MIKVVISKGVGSLVLSKAAFERLIELGNKYAVEDMGFYEDRKNKKRDEDFYYFPHYKMRRDDPDLVQVAEELGEDTAPDFFGRKEVVIVEVPDDVEWFVDQYEGGSEFVREHHRTWSYDKENNKTVEHWTTREG